MTTGTVVLLTLAIGFVAGLRTMTAPAVVAWAAHLHWFRLEGTPLALMGTVAAVAAFTVLGCIELVGDKLPSTPSRLRFVGLTGRLVMGGLAGAALALAGSRSATLGGCLGPVGAVAGALVGHRYRTALGRALPVPDAVWAIAEDLVAIGGGILIVSRFRS